MPNFVYELLDVRLIADAKRNGYDKEGAPRASLTADVTQDLRYQLTGGLTTMMTGSRIYVYARDRCACPAEHLRWQGWGEDIDETVCDKDIIDEKRSLVEGQQAKKRRGKKVLQDTKVRDLSGNSESLPDLSSIALPLIYVMNANLFKHALKMAEIPLLEIAGAGSSLPEAQVVISADISQKELHRIERALMHPDAAGGEEPVDELDDDTPADH